MYDGAPRMTKVQLRNLWFQVHKWLGLALAVLIIPICLTGSALVWHDWLERQVEPQRFAVSGTATVAPASYVAAARAVLPAGTPIASLRLPEDAGHPAVVGAGAGRDRTNVYLDPPSARVLDIAPANAGLVRVLHQLHGSLLVPGVGRQIVGWIGVAMVVSSISGLWLWWPLIGSWRRGLRWRRHNNLDTNLHHQMGFWIVLPLFVLSLTGAWISFPAFFNPLVGEPARGRGPDRAAMMRAKPLETPATPIDRAIAVARAAQPGEIRQVTFPTDLKPEWSVNIAGKSVTVDDARGTAQAAKGGGPNPNSIARWMRRIHDGTDMGAVWQIVIFLGGILPAALGVTGIIMWWRARTWKGALKARRQAMAAAE